MKKAQKILATLVAAITASPLIAVVSCGKPHDWAKGDTLTTFELNSNIALATDKKKPNLVEIFADGLDPWYVQQVLVSDTNLASQLKDFVDFPNFFTSFSATVFGKLQDLGGRDFETTKVIKNMQNLNNKNLDFETEVWRNGAMMEAFREHLQNLQPFFSNATVFNEVDSVKPHPSVIDGWNWLSASQKQELKNVQANDNVINYSGESEWMQDFLKTQNTSFFSRQDSLDYVKSSSDPSLNQPNFTENGVVSKAAMAKVKVDNSISRGGYLFLQHNISHPDRNTAIDGTLMANQGIYDGIRASLYDLLYVVNKLKASKDQNGRSLYDNSMIVIYGDHADHSDHYNDGTQTYSIGDIKDAMIQDNSNLMIKYPDQTNNASNSVSYDKNHTIDSADLNYILTSYFNHSFSKPMDIFNLPTFNHDRPLAFVSRKGWDSKITLGHIDDVNGNSLNHIKLDNEGFGMYDTKDPNYLSSDQIDEKLFGGEYALPKK